MNLSYACELLIFFVLLNLWIGTTCAIVVEMARRFRLRTVYIGIVVMFALIGFSWGPMSWLFCLLSIFLIGFILPPLRLILHSYCREEGYELPSEGKYKVLVYLACIPAAGAVFFLELLWLVQIAHSLGLM